MTDAPNDESLVFRFQPPADREQTPDLRRASQLNADELRRVLGGRLERATHRNEPTQIWKHGEEVAVLVGTEWFWEANELMRRAGRPHAHTEFDPLPRRESPRT
jgi:hypothetical protein